MGYSTRGTNAGGAGWDFRLHPVEPGAKTHHTVGRLIEEGMPVNCLTAKCERVYLNKRTGEVEGGYSREMCEAHYKRWKRMYDDEVMEVFDELRQMDWWERNKQDGLSDHNYLLAERHAVIRTYMRMYEEGGWRPVAKPQACLRGNCLGKHHADGLCRKHYDQDRYRKRKQERKEALDATAR